jgi:Uma2 family endonuclease
MVTTTQVPFEVYLRSEFEPAAEYVYGEILERPMGELDHADWQAAISTWFLNHAKDWNIRVFPELRVQVTPQNFRIPDVTVLDRSLPIEQTITRPPLAVFEVLSPEDTVKRLKQKLAEYAKMGIPQIWVVDPDNGSFERYEAGRLGPATRFEQGVLQFDVAEIATLLQASGD